MFEMPEIDREKCDGCGLCLGVCKSFVLVDGVITAVAIEECNWCTLCEEVCPHGAISCRFEIVVEEHT